MWTESIRDEHRSSSNDAGNSHVAESLREQARTLAGSLAWMPSVRSSEVFQERCTRLKIALQTVLGRGERQVSSEVRLLQQNATLLENCFSDVYQGLHQLRRIPHIRRDDGTVIPRPLAIAEGCLAFLGYRCNASLFSSYMAAFQEVTVLDLLELWTLVPALKLVLLEHLIEQRPTGTGEAEDRKDAAVYLDSLRRMNEVPWGQVIEPLIGFEAVLQKDPSGAYPLMEAASRNVYRNEIADIASRSDSPEIEVAAVALELAEAAHRSPHSDPRVTTRLSHIGYYLIAEGAEALKKKVGFRPSFRQWLQQFLKSHPDDFYIPAIALLTAVLAATLINLSEFDYWSFGTYVFILLILMLPCSEAAVQIVNYVVLSLLPAQPLPKLDFHEGIPPSCATLVTVPTLLLNEEQVRRVVENLEVRYLGNHDPNLHFALLTDLPDSPTPPAGIDPLASLCAELIDNLNEKYKSNGAGSFFLLHRERKYNPRERAWIGWERKRGKLLELNRFICGEPVSYTKTVGDLSLLLNIRFVIALDADTLLPRDTARQMTATLAHPLNQVIIDPETNIAVAGYGILQPRVGVSVRSAARSRLAKIWSGQTGLDIYTRAISDVYQDLYGEGTYVGKGIYEVAPLHRILDGRFPSNLLLSHDLIEGAYTRSGLVSDIEIIEDYPSVYSAHNQRKHRWLRGDWQIAEWLLPRVPGPGGKRVANPISLVSRWKIFDNLRRSLVEPATLLLFVLGWVALPGSPLYWTLATLALLFLPNLIRLAVDLAGMVLRRDAHAVSTLPQSLLVENMGVVLTLVFLAHQMLISLDAMVRALIRRLVTGEKMLEWVTAAQAEEELHRRTPLEIYLDWTPALALGLGMLVWFLRGRNAVLVALPILLLWASSRFISVWLNRSPHSRYEKSPADRIFLRRIALRTWRFFAEFSNSENGWLVPDNVREDPWRVDNRLSPTNLGFLLNARQVACQFGHITVPEFAELTVPTLKTVGGLRRYHGHLFNWYDAEKHEPMHPFEISSVDSGNLVASLWTLEQGALEFLRNPLAGPQIADGILDYLRELQLTGTLDRRILKRFRRDSQADWLRAVQDLGGRMPSAQEGNGTEAAWLRDQLNARIENVDAMLRSYMPWLLAEFRPMRKAIDELGFGPSPKIQLDRLPEFIDVLQFHVASGMPVAESSSAAEEEVERRLELRALLPAARQNAARLIDDLTFIAKEAGRLAAETDFTFLLNPARKLLSVAYSTQAQGLNAACYDMLASESRIALFIAVAKSEASQESWFALSRRHNVVDGRTVLLSWSGTMFEYLMPTLWTHTYPDTLLDRAAIEAVRAQRRFGSRRGVPWGVSESAAAERAEDGNYSYFAFGLPELGLRDEHPTALVIAPYAAALAQHVSPGETLSNLRKMEQLGWLGKYGLYESVDFTAQKQNGIGQPEIVHMWMGHHQGMILLSIANSLFDGIVRRWFHTNPFVQSAELLLQEKPIKNLGQPSFRTRTAA